MITGFYGDVKVTHVLSYLMLLNWLLCDVICWKPCCASFASCSVAWQKTRSEKEVTLLMTKVSKLESLCRALQEERRKLTG